MQITEGKVEAYRAKVKVSFKYEGEQWLCSGCKLCPPVECHLGMSMDNLPAIAAGHEPNTIGAPSIGNFVRTERSHSAFRPVLLAIVISLDFP